jgi:diguanylate cyclase (GGDEF)-like protein
MQAPALPDDETERLAALRDSQLLDSSPDPRFDRIVRIAQHMFQVPIAAISLVDADRQWFKARLGLEAAETPRDVSFCGHAIHSSEVFVVEDAKADVRFVGNPLVEDAPGIRFYAGYPIKARDGARIGTLCVIDRAPRSFTEGDREVLRDLGRIIEEEIAVVELATHDALTGLANRRGFEQVIQKVLAVCDRSETPVSLLYFDLDGFKLINDLHGHKEGDRALVEFSRLLTQAFRSSDVVARLGGDEFIVVLTGAGAKDLQLVVDRFAEAVAKHNAEPGRRYSLAYSTGVFTRDPSRQRTLAELLEEADRRMYEQKRRRKRQVGYASE